MASGKGEVANILADRAFSYISLSDIVREEAGKQSRSGDNGDGISREQMQDLGNRLRAEGGAGVLARIVVEKIQSSPPGRWIIDGIRNPAEVDHLRTLRPFYLIGVRALRETILLRMKHRGRGTDIADTGELEKRLDREWGGDEPEDGQQVGRCMHMTDFIVENNHTINDLKKNVFCILSNIEASNGE